MDLEALYLRLPRIAQDAAVSLEGWRIVRRRYDRNFERLLADCERRVTLPPEEMRAFRDERLRRFVRHAATTVPYYRELFAERGLDPDGLRTLADLARLPLLDRSTVQSRAGEFRSAAVPASECLIAHTSGTTGAGLRFPVTRDAHREQWAVWWRYRGWHGIDRARLCLLFGGRSIVPPAQREPPFWRHNRPGRQILFSGYHLGQHTAPAYLAEVARHPRCWIHGYPSAIALLASFALQDGRALDVERVSLGAESLLPQQAELIRRAFGCRPIEHYGMAEGVANVSQCPAGALHVDEDYAAVELLPLGAGAHRIVGTNLSNPAFPLLRYDSGDVCRLDERGCECGIPGRVIAAIDGRREDYVVTRSGARLGRLDHIFKDLIRIREAQIRQSEAGRMTLVVVRGPGYDESDERRLREETRKRVGDEVEFDVEYAERIPRTSSGKVRLVVSTLSEGQIDRAG